MGITAIAFVLKALEQYRVVIIIVICLTMWSLSMEGVFLKQPLTKPS